MMSAKRTSRSFLAHYTHRRKGLKARAAQVTKHFVTCREIKRRAIQLK